jgi:DNA polymerase-3 subunit alpha
MPDFDVDFCKDRREEVIDYVLDKYGTDNVAKITTFNTLASKAAIRDVGRVLGMSYSDVDKIAKAIPMDGAAPASLEKALKMSAELRRAREEDERINTLFKIAIDLEGLNRNTGTHAAGVVIAKDRIDECVPLFMSDKGGVSTQFNMIEVEELGLLKMDFLGLRTLTVIQGAIDMIKENHGVDIDFSNDNYDDPAVYSMISSGNNDGVFQLESAGMSNFFTQLVPTCLEDVIAGIALYRPGPMDHIPEYLRNRKDPSQIKYLTPQLRKCLEVTDGVMIYQEQAMEIVRELAGFSMGRSDEVRRFMSKKKLDKMEKERKVFINGEQDGEGNWIVPGCKRNGIDPKIANQIFDNLTSFASYAFNKSHAAVYAILSYRTAYLKLYYPLEFMASIMSSFIGENLSQITRYISNCKQMGIEVLPPDVLKSGIQFGVIDGKIRFGLQAVKSVGSAAEIIINGRDLNNPPTSMLEFLKSLDLDKINRKAIESLIKVGAFDCFNPNRAKHLAVYEMMLDTIKSDKRNVHGGQMSLGDLLPDVMESADLYIELPDIDDVSLEQKLEWEKELIGVYVSGHPLDRYSIVIDHIKKDETTYVTTDMIEAPEENPQMHDNMKVCVVGFVSAIRTTMTKKNELMAFIEIEDYFGSVGAVVFSEMYKNNMDVIYDGAPVIIRGILQYREDKEPSIRTIKISSLDVAVKYYLNK